MPDNYESLVLNKFRFSNPNFTTKLSDDPTMVILQLLSESLDMDSVYINYYALNKYDLDSVQTRSSFDIPNHRISPRLIDCIISITLKNDTINSYEYLILPKFSKFTSDNNMYSTFDDCIITNELDTNIVLIEGDNESVTVTPTALNPQNQMKLVNQYILPEYSELYIEDQLVTQVDHAEYESIDCYSLVLKNDGYYYLILSDSLTKKVYNYTNIRLQYIFLQESGTSPTEISSDTPVYDLNNSPHEYEVSDITIKTEYYNPTRSADIVYTFNQGITKDDYSKLINNHPAVIKSKLYDISDKLNGTVIEINENNPVIDLAYDSDKATAADATTDSLTMRTDTLDGLFMDDKMILTKIMPMYMYAVVYYADTNYKNKDKLVEYLKSHGLNMREVLTDYGHIPEVSMDQGYTINPNYHPYQLPYYVNQSNGTKDETGKIELTIPEDDYPQYNSYPGYNMPDLVLQIVEAKSLSIDTTLRVEIDSDEASEVFQIYIDIINRIQQIFSVSEGNYTFNSLIDANDIINDIYSLSEKLILVNTDGLTYYRDGFPTTSQTVQLAPDELPMLGKLTVVLDYHLVPTEGDTLVTLDDLLMTKAQFETDENALIDDNTPIKITIKLEDEVILDDNNAFNFKPNKVRIPLNLTLWYTLIEADTYNVGGSIHAKTLVTRTEDAGPISNTDDPDRVDDTPNRESGLYVDIPPEFENEYDY